MDTCVLCGLENKEPGRVNHSACVDKAIRKAVLKMVTPSASPPTSAAPSLTHD